MASRFCLALLFLVALPLAAQPPSTPCAANGNVRFLCGIPAAEDSVAIPNSPWLLLSGLALGSGSSIKLVNTQSGEVTPLYPASTPAQPDLARYPDCEHPPAANAFTTHGLALAPLSPDAQLLYAAHQGERNSVEIFRLETAGPLPSLHWLGCILLPEHSSPNAVAALPEAGLAIVSMDDGSADRLHKLGRGEALGRLFEWQAGKGLQAYPDLALQGGNGLAASADGRWLYVSAWAGGELLRIDRQHRRIDLRTTLGLLPDNLKWTAEGTLLLAAQNPPATAIAACTGNPCLADWQILAVDPDSLQTRPLVNGKANSLVNYATGATQVQSRLYITNRGDNRVLVLELPANNRGSINVDFQP